MVNDTNIAWVNLPTNAHLTTSWIVNAGRAFAIRTLLKIGGVDFVDERISMDEFKQRIAAVPKLTHAVIEDAGHMLHHDQPDVLAGLMEEFFSLKPVT